MTRLRIIAAMAGLLATAAYAATLAVGPGKPWPKPCAAIAAAASGDTIEIDAAGDYTGDVCAWSRDRLTLRGTGGRARIDAGGRTSQGKAIWVIAGNDTVVENIEFSGAAVPDRNGAGIRQEGRNLTLRNCYFHDNETGLLAGDSPSSEILIEYSEFGFNGAGDGQSHNLYVNHVGRFTMRFSYSHHSRVGHLVKSRAAENYILYNRLSDEADGTGSYEIDLPNGGRSVVMGNVVEQGPKTGNPTLLAYREEGPNAANPETALFVVNNTFVNHRAGPATFVFLAPAVPTAAVIRNNIFSGPGAVTNQSGAILEGNAEGPDAAFSSPDRYDFHLRPGSPAVDAGTDAAPDLTPRFHYVHPACGEGRRTIGAAIDAGAFEFGGAAYDAAAPPRCRMIFRGGIVNGADFTPAPLTPGEIAAIFGANLIPDDSAAGVTVNDKPARLLAARADQLVIEMPSGLPPGDALASVSSDGVKVAEAQVEIAAVAPAIFLSALSPVQSGALFDLYFTGYGDAAPDPQSMQIAIGGKPAELRQVEVLTGYASVARMSLLAPPLDPGEYALELTIAGAAARPAKVIVVSAAAL